MNREQVDTNGHESKLYRFFTSGDGFGKFLLAYACPSLREGVMAERWWGQKYKANDGSENTLRTSRPAVQSSVNTMDFAC